MKDQIRNFTETEWFNVISRFADKLGIRVAKLRLIFIYLTFATFGLTFVGYFIMFSIFVIFAIAAWVLSGSSTLI